MMSISSQIELFASALLALERRFFLSWTFNGENVVETLAFSLAGNEKRYKILDGFDFWSDRTNCF